MTTLVQIHSIVRWLVLTGFVSAAATAWTHRGRAWTERADRPATVATILLDVQVALGFVLWFGSEAWSSGFFFAVVHPVAMLLALGAMHASLHAARAAGSDGGRRRLVLGTGITLLIVLAAIPWWR